MVSFTIEDYTYNHYGYGYCDGDDAAECSWISDSLLDHREADVGVFSYQIRSSDAWSLQGYAVDNEEDINIIVRMIVQNQLVANRPEISQYIILG